MPGNENFEREFRFQPIGYFYGVFKEKFGTPRQSMMIKGAGGVLILRSDHRYVQALKYLDSFSHLWILFVFDRDLEKDWHPMIMPPRTEKPNRVGVFASRSPHRPNPIGMSVAKIEGVSEIESHQFAIHLSGADLLDGTPVLDIKPYLPYSDIIEEASSGWADPKIPRYPVQFSSEVEEFISKYIQPHQPEFRELLLSVIELDPRPTTLRRRAPIESQKSQSKKFAFRFMGWNIQCVIVDHEIQVLEIRLIDTIQCKFPRTTTFA